MPAVTQETIINSALELVGHTALASFDTDEVGASSLRRYLLLKKRMLAEFPWRFAIKEVSLAQLADRGSQHLTGWLYAYQVPTDCLLVLGIDGDNLDAPFEIVRGELYTDLEDNVVLRYIADVSETYFSGLFTDAITLSLAAQFALSIADNSSRSQELEMKAERAWLRARLRDSQQGPAKSMIRAVKRTIHTLPTKRY